MLCEQSASAVQRAVGLSAVLAQPQRAVTEHAAVMANTREDIASGGTMERVRADAMNRSAATYRMMGALVDVEA